MPPGTGRPGIRLSVPFSWPSKAWYFFAHLAEVRGDALQLVDIEAGVVRRAGEGGHQRFGGRVAIGGAHRGDGGIDAVDAGFNGLQQRHLRHAGGGVAVQVQG